MLMWKERTALSEEASDLRPLAPPVSSAMTTSHKYENIKKTFLSIKRIFSNRN